MWVCIVSFNSRYVSLLFLLYLFAVSGAGLLFLWVMYDTVAPSSFSNLYLKKKQLLCLLNFMPFSWPCLLLNNPFLLDSYWSCPWPFIGYLLSCEGGTGIFLLVLQVRGRILRDLPKICNLAKRFKYFLCFAPTYGMQANFRWYSKKHLLFDKLRISSSCVKEKACFKPVFLGIFLLTIF